MQEYKFEIINARFIASGVAIQAKGLAYRLRPNKGRDAQKNEDYKLGTLPGYATGGGTTEGGAAITKPERSGCARSGGGSASDQRRDGER